MNEPGPFSAFLARASGDDPRERDRAYAELLRWVRIVVRAEMGRRLRDHRESADVCQSIAKSFAEDFEAGRVHFENERALAAYLRLAIRNKLAELARRDTALKRGGGARTVGDDGAAPHTQWSDEQTPFNAEDRERLRASMSDEERHLIELRMRGLDWQTIADQTGTSAATVRQRYSRIVRRLREASEPSE